MDVAAGRPRDPGTRKNLGGLRRDRRAGAVALLRLADRDLDRVGGRAALVAVPSSAYRSSCSSSMQPESLIDHATAGRLRRTKNTPSTSAGRARKPRPRRSTPTRPARAAARASTRTAGSRRLARCLRRGRRSSFALRSRAVHGEAGAPKLKPPCELAARPSERIEVCRLRQRSSTCSSTAPDKSRTAPLRASCVASGPTRCPSSVVSDQSPMRRASASYARLATFASG